MPVAAATVWYGFLETARHHPSLKLGGAIALAGLSIAILTSARAAPWPGAPPHEHEHSAMVELHPLRFGLACASMSAAEIHFAVIEQHLSEYWLYGWFFVAVASAQLIWAALAVVCPFRLMLLAGAVGNALVALAWIVTRTYGSLVGPEATTKAMAGFGDIVSTILEAFLVLGCIVLLGRPGLLEPRLDHRGEMNSLISIGVVLLTSLSLYSAVGGSPFVSHVG
jgi:hypothetical protein